jgi:hypothetical protein
MNGGCAFAAHMQVRMAKAPGVTLASVSRLEQRSDLLLSTLTIRDMGPLAEKTRPKVKHLYQRRRGLPN